MSACECGKPATQRCAKKCGYLACDYCAKTMHRCGLKWVEAKVMQFVVGGRQVGQGESGTAYVNDAMDKNILIKVSRDGNVCGNLRFEFDMGEYIAEVAERTGFMDDNVQPVKMYSHLLDVKFDGMNMKTRCALIMQRIHRPELKFGSDNQLAYQAHFGRVSESTVVVPYYGNVIGPSAMREIVSERTLEDYAKSLGRFLAFLHYAVKIDGYDVEYILGHTLDNPKLKIFAIDFSNVRKIESYDSDLAKSFAWTLRNYENVPRRGDLYAAFKRGYSEVAKKYNQESFAMMLLQDYEKLV